jgi:N-acetylmuramoyl-L-alanine amidase
MGVPEGPVTTSILRRVSGPRSAAPWQHPIRILLICASGGLLPASSLAQSTEIRKNYDSGQTEIRKSQPAANGRARPREPEALAPAAAPDARTAKMHRVAPASPQEPAAETGEAVIATQAELTKERGLTRFSLQLSSPVRYQLSSMANPYRIVLDLPDVDFQLPVAAGQQGQGLVRAYRYGLFAPGKARVVIDTTEPVRVQKHAIAAHAAGSGVRLSLDLAPTDEATFLAGVAGPQALRQPEPPAEDPRPAPPPQAANGRPVVVIDPGHGGPDPGAVGVGFREKDVVLAVSLQLRAALEATGRYDVHMTRASDVFIPLGGRVAFSRSKGASLFVSIHANSVPTESPNAAIVRGAAVYTLSEEATTRAAQRLAEQENAADLAAGADSRLDMVITDVDRILSDPSGARRPCSRPTSAAGC